MRELVEFMAKSLVHESESVRVTETEENGSHTFHLEVAPEDKGRIIGKQGRVVQSMRALLRVAAIKRGTRADLEVI